MAGRRASGLIVSMCAILAANCASPQLPAGKPEVMTAPAAARATQAAPAVAPPPPVPQITGTAVGATGPVALLLPLSGAQRAAAETLRDGFVAAWLADRDSARPDILFLDEEREGAAAAYQGAISQGAGLVVGPLLRESVAQVATVAGGVPTLALNQLDTAATAPPDFWQFALAPEDEAREVAARALRDGHRRALALAPDSDWGRRTLGAFVAGLEEGGGSVVAYRFYDPQQTDFTDLITRLLLLDESEERYQSLQANLGIKLGFEARRRTDVDFMFLAAGPAVGRLLWPQLKFLHAGDLPTYATSALHIPGNSSDMDLDGVMFTDVPALLSADPPAPELRAALAARWPAGSTALLRFFAMGHDAYTIARTIARAGPIQVRGLTGELDADPSRRIRRRTAWAQFSSDAVTARP